jgi:cysteine-S-conjugate beta-lyase
MSDAYDFDRRIDRRGTASEKWDYMEKVYGSAELLPLWTADMEFTAPPEVVQALAARVRHGVFGYTVNTEPVYQAIQMWLRTRQAWPVERDWVRFSPGVVPGIVFALKTFTEPGDGVLIQPPVYPRFSKLVQFTGRRLLNSPLVLDGRRYRMDLADLRAKLRSGVRALILCSPHNPVGRVWTADELRDLGDVCNDEGVLVIADEVHGDLTYPGVRHTPYASLGATYAARSITFTAPSKTFNLAGLQTAVAVIPDAELRQRWDTFMQELFEGILVVFGNVFGVTALQAAYTRGGPWLDHLREYLAGNLAFVEKYIAREIPEIEVIHPEGTYLVWLDCRRLGMEPEELAAFLQAEAGVALNHGYTFGPEGAGFERLNIACPRSMLEEGLDRLAAAVRRRRTDSRDVGGPLM